MSPYSYCSNTRPETDNKQFKRVRRSTANDEAVLANGMHSMKISAVETDPLLAFCDSQIPFLNAYELSNMFDEAVFNENFGIIKLFNKHEVLEDKVDSDHLECLCRSSTDVSTEILVYLIDNSLLARDEIDKNLSRLLFLCIPHGLNKFRLLWSRFNGTELDDSSLSGIITKIAALHCREFYDFVMESLSQHENSQDIFYEALISSVYFYRHQAVHFLLENDRVPVSSLNLEIKMKAFNSAVINNCSFVVRLLLKDADLLGRVKVMPRSPWLTAINRDHPEVLDSLMATLSGSFNPYGLVIYAFSQKSVKVLNYFREKGTFTASMFNSMASTAIFANSVEALDLAVAKTGMDVNDIKFDGLNILTLAVQKNCIEIVEYLLKICHFDPNTLNEQYDSGNVRTTFTAIYFAETVEMVRLLAENGADLNFKYVKQNHFGAIVKSTTALHKAASDQNFAVFSELIASGADMTIPDNFGITNEEFYHRILSNMIENF